MKFLVALIIIHIAGLYVKIAIDYFEQRKFFIFGCMVGYVVFMFALMVNVAFP